jgi:hypothetical protein
MTTDRETLLSAIEDAKAGRWETAHEAAQSLEGDADADWLHAILHKIEGDAANSRYWYRRTVHKYGDWRESSAELDALAEKLLTSG